MAADVQTANGKQIPGLAVPSDVEQKIKRGRERALELAPLRNECLSFWRGNQYVHRSHENTLIVQPTGVSVRGKGRPPHIQRLTRNLIKPLVRQEVSAATSRVPSYNVLPSTSDPDVQSAAAIAERVALYGYDAWQVRRATVSVVEYAIVADEGFAWPYWDSTIGPPLEDDGTSEGDVRIRVFGPNEVYWEPGVRFEDSRWHAVEQARSVEDVMDMPGYLGGKLTPDAASSTMIEQSKKRKGTRLVLVTEYLERPGKKHAQGRRVVVANGRQILPEEPYPLLDENGDPLDEPVLHKLSVVIDPDSDRDMGLVRDWLDAQRTKNRMASKASEWATLALNPQVILQNMVMREPLTNEPGAKFTAYGSGTVTWRPVPPVPPEIFEMEDRAKADMGFMAAQNQIPQNVDTARGIQALIELDQSAREDFLANLADWHSRVMRHCLYLVARHYTEPRLLLVNGRWGAEPIQNFKGAHLRSQVNVRVYAESLAPRTRAGMQQTIMNLAQLFPGWLDPNRALEAIQNGTGEGLIQSYELDVGRANRIIQLIKQGPEALMSVPPGPADPSAPPGTPDPPGWMPRWCDNTQVHKQIFGDWFKTLDYDTLNPGMREAANLYYQGLLQIEQQKAMQEQAKQAAQAEQMGMQNAAQPGAKPLPSQPKISGPGAQPSS